MSSFKGCNRDVQGQRATVFGRGVVFVDVARFTNRPARITDRILNGFDHIAVQDIGDIAAHSAFAGDACGLFKGAVSGRDVTVEVYGENADVDAFDDVFGKLFESRQLFSFLHLRTVE